jgi:hypothetical protein
LHLLAFPTPCLLILRGCVSHPLARGLARGIFGLTPALELSPSRPAVPGRQPVLAQTAEADARAARDAELARLLQSASAGNAKSFEHVYDLTIGYTQALLRRMLPTSKTYWPRCTCKPGAMSRVSMRSAAAP